ncbi:hypothetical protein [Pectobacterium brasiliense]|uniref:hypothetical protein n=1 Tax=Pectobacterium brasiliense TaxID=180957 RepID=UPI00307CC483
MQNENELNPFILNTLKNRSMLTRAITVSLIILLIISASTISILIATGNDSQKASIERLLGFKKELLNPGDIVYLNTPKEKTTLVFTWVTQKAFSRLKIK